jgi:hypothetical protein
MISEYTCPYCGKTHNNPPPPNGELGYKLIGGNKNENQYLDRFAPCSDKECMALYKFLNSPYHRSLR